MFLGFRCPFIFHQFIVNNYSFFQTLLYYYYRESGRGRNMLQSFFTVFLFVVRCSRQMPCCPGLLWEASHIKRLEDLVPGRSLFRLYGIFSSRLSRRPFSSSALLYRAFSDKRYLCHSVLKNW